MKKLVILIAAVCVATSFSPSKKLTWMAIGDSITYLNDHADETGGRITKGYMTMITEKLPGITYINQGHNGWTSGDIANDIEKLGLIKADIYSVFLGTNDWWHGRPIGKLADYQNNTGNTTLFLNHLQHKNIFVYVLPKQKHSWNIHTPARTNPLMISADINGQSVNARVQVS